MDKRKRSTMLKWIVMVEVVLILMIVNVLLVAYMDKVCNVEAESINVGMYQTSPVEQQIKETSLAAAANKAAASKGEQTGEVLLHRNNKKI